MEDLLHTDINNTIEATTLELTKQELEESMLYASKLQASILPNPDLFKQVFSDAFVFFQPKDILSGDFYWIFPYHGQVYFAVGDCTGHGVPGAMVSMAGNSILRQVIRMKNMTDPANIISLLDSEITALFNEHQTQGYTRDGMDIAFCRFDLLQEKGYFCGAGRPLIGLRKGELIEYSGSRNSVGFIELGNKTFTTICFELQKGDQYYLFSDGYTDQFGGEKVKKFNRKRFRTLLQSIAQMEMKKQQKELSMAFRNWKGQHQQLDDVCVLGVKL